MQPDAAQLKDLLSVVGEIADPGLAEPWDNVGLMVGDPGQSVTGVLVALDPAEDVMEEAQEKSCNVLLTHHPLIFKPLKSLVLNRYPGNLLAKAMKDGIAVIGCHTNLDKVSGGVNDALAETIGLVNSRVLEQGSGESATGFGRIGSLANAVSFEDFCQGLIQALQLPVLKFAGVSPDSIDCVAVCGGSGSELAEKAKEAGAQVYITGEVKHSTARWAEDAGYCVIDAGHFATENLVVKGLAALVRSRIQQKGFALDVHETRVQAAPFRYVYSEEQLK